MTDKTRQDSGSTHIIRYALELGLLWVAGDGRDKVREALDALDALESQLEAIGAGGVSGPLMGRASLQSPGFDAADMATASAQGFRDGVASLAANAGEPVATVFTMEALPPGGGVKYHATIHKALPAGTKLYTHPSPPAWVEPLHITHGPLMRHAAALLRSRKPVLPDHESVAAELELAVDGHPTPSGEPSAEWLEVARIAAAHPPPPKGMAGWKHDCAALLMNDVELWIQSCPHCGKPRDTAPPTAQAEGWRPIETAPKDCQAILVTEGRFCHCVEWNEEFDWWAVDDNKLGPFRLRGSSPTHWMPLPPPPTSAEGVEHAD